MSEFFWLNLMTASRIVVCVPLWLWCWWKRPRLMMVWMPLCAAWFIWSDWYDGLWAKSRGLTSELGYWLDHGADFLFYGAVILALIKGSREPEMKRRKKRIVPAPAKSEPAAPTTGADAPTPPAPPQPPPV